MNTILEWFAVFSAVFALDFCWVFYIRHVERNSHMGASLWAAFLFLTSAGATVSYVANPWLLVPATAGAFFGTLVGVLRAKRGIPEGEQL